MNITQTILSGHRRIIVPQGILDPSKNNVIHIPKELANTQAPLVVTQTRKGLIARILPDFNDELSIGHVSQFQHLTAAPIICPTESRSKKTSKRAEDVTYNRTYQADTTERSIPAQGLRTTASKKAAQGFGYSSGDSHISYPKLFHANSRATRRFQNLPQEGHSISIDAPEGINIKSLQQMGSQSASSGRHRASSDKQANITSKYCRMK